MFCEEVRHFAGERDDSVRDVDVDVDHVRETVRGQLRLHGVVDGAVVDLSSGRLRRRTCGEHHGEEDGRNDDGNPGAIFMEAAPFDGDAKATRLEEGDTPRGRKEGVPPCPG